MTHIKAAFFPALFIAIIIVLAWADTIDGVTP